MNAEKTNLVLNAALDAIIFIDKKGSITYWNTQAEKIFGWKEKEVLGLNISEVIVPPVFRSRHDKGMERYNQSGHGPALNVLLELSALHKNGKEFPIELTVLPIKEEGDEFFCAFIRDITERKKQETELKKLSERLAYATQATSDAIWDWNLKEGTMYRSEGYFTLYGYDFYGQVWPKGFWESKVHADDLEPVQAQIKEALDNPDRFSWTGEYRFLKASGDYAFVREKITIIRTPSGTPIRFVGALQDITVAKKQEQALLQERNILRAIIDNITEMVFVKDRGLRHIINNKANLGLLGAATEEETLGKTASDYFKPEIADSIVQDDLQVLQSGKALYDREEVVTAPNGEKRWLVTTKIPLRDENQEIIAIAGISRDVSFLHKKQKGQVLVQDIIVTLGKIDTLQESLADILRMLSTYLGYTVGEAWLVSPDKEEILLKGTWADQPIADLFSHNQSTGFKYCEGMPGGIWQKKQLVVWNHIQEESKIRRTELVKQAGLHAAIGLPVMYGEEVLAVFTFFSKDLIQYSEELSELMQQVAVPIALAIQWKKNDH